MSKMLRALFLVLALAAPAAAQVTGPPHVFVAGTVANPDEVNLNFSTVYAAALNRSGGTMTGNLLFSTDNTLDIGASGATRPRDLFLGRNAAIGGTLGVTGATTLAALSATTGSFSSTLAVTGATTLSAALGGTSATFSGTVTGNLFSGSGASLTSIPETSITDGSLLARVAANETISGGWTFSNNPVLNNAVPLTAKNASGTSVRITEIDASNQHAFGPTDAQVAAACCNETIVSGNTLSLRTNGVARTSLNTTGTLTHGYAVALNGKISPTTLSANVNDYSPTGIAATRTVRLITNDTTQRDITGIGALVDGFEMRLCNIGVSGVNGQIRLLSEGVDTSSSAANRFAGASTVTISHGNCTVVTYDGTSSRWRFSA